jgi:hypothetical protein
VIQGLKEEEKEAEEEGVNYVAAASSCRAIGAE